VYTIQLNTKLKYLPHHSHRRQVSETENKIDTA